MITTLYSSQAVAQAVGFSDRKKASVLRDASGHYLLANHDVMLSPPEALAVAAVLIFGGGLKPHQRQAILEDIVADREFRTLAFSPTPGLIYLVVPEADLDPFLAPQEPWDAVSIDVGVLGVGLFVELDRLVNDNPKWARRNSAAAGAEFVDDAGSSTKKSQTDLKRRAKKLANVNSLRDLVERG